MFPGSSLFDLAYLIWEYLALPASKEAGQCEQLIVEGPSDTLMPFGVGMQTIVAGITEQWKMLLYHRV